MYRLFAVIALLFVTTMGAWAKDPIMFPTPQDAVEAFWGRGDIAEGMNLGRFSLFVVRGTVTKQEMLYYDRLLDPMRGYCAARSRCGPNLKNLGTCLEMYSTDHKGRYPTSLQQLVPSYCKNLPSCPTNDAAYRYEVNGTAFTIICQGRHPGQPKGQPCFNSEKGLMMAPDTAPAPRALVEMGAKQWKILGTQMDGNRAVVQTSEEFSIDGRPHQITVAYTVVKRDGNWTIDPSRPGPDLAAEIKTLPGAGRKAWEQFIRRRVVSYGVGGVVLALARYAESHK